MDCHIDVFIVQLQEGALLGREHEIAGGGVRFTLRPHVEYRAGIKPLDVATDVGPHAHPIVCAAAPLAPAVLIGGTRIDLRWMKSDNPWVIGREIHASAGIAVCEVIHDCLVRVHVATARRVIVVLVVAAKPQIDHPVVVRRDAERSAECIQVSRAVGLPEESIGMPAVRRLLGNAETRSDGVVDRHVDHAAKILLTVVAGTQQKRRLEIPTRLRADDVNRATGRVLAEQRPLRASHDFDALNVDRIQHLPDRVGQVVAVDIDAGARRT